MKKSKKSKKYYGGGPYQSLLPLLVAFIVGVMTPILNKKVKPASAPAPAANPQATGKGKTGGRTLRQLKERARERGADAEDLNALDNSEDPMAAAIGLVRAKTPKFPSEGEEWKFVYINSKEHRRIYQGKV